MHTRKWMRNAWRIPLYIVLTALSVFMIIPFVYLLSTSLKSLPETVKVPIVWLPEKCLWENYAKLFHMYNVFVYYGNTVFYTFVTLAIQLIMVPLAAYAYARLSFPLKGLTFMFMMAMLMIPSHMLILPRYLMMNRVGLIDSLWALILVALPDVGGMFLIRQSIMIIPRELDEASMIDGCSYFGTFFRVLLPLTKNALFTVQLFSFMFLWNDMLWPLIAVRSSQKFVLSVLISTMQGQYLTDMPLLCCISVCATLPILVVFLFTQKKIVMSVSMSGMKA